MASARAFQLLDLPSSQIELQFAAQINQKESSTHTWVITDAPAELHLDIISRTLALDGGSLVDHLESVSTRLRAILPTINTEIQLVDERMFLAPTAYDLASQFLKFTIFLLSNNHLQPDIHLSGKILDWMQGSGRTQYLDYVLSLKSPIFESLVETIFSCAVQAENAGIVEYMLSKGFDCSGILCSGYHSPLVYAALRGNIDLARILIEAGVDVNSKDSQHSTPLEHAARRGHLELLRLLVDSGANVDYHNLVDPSPLLEAAGRRHGRVVDLLLSVGANVNHGDIYRYTALHAVLANQISEDRFAEDDDIIKLIANLLQAGAHTVVDLGLEITRTIKDRRIVYKKGDKALDLAVRLPNCGIKLASLLYQFGARPTGRTLCYTAETGNSELVQTLVDLGANPNESDPDGYNALIWATYHGDKELIVFLISRGADVNRRASRRADSDDDSDDSYNYWLRRSRGVYWQAMTALQVAAYTGNTELVQLLLGLGADVNATPGSAPSVAKGRAVVELSALASAAASDNVAVVQLVIVAGAVVNDTTRQQSALPIAIRNGNISIIQCLVKAGADFNLPSAYGETPLRAAILAKNTDLVYWLLWNGADVNSVFAKRSSSTALAAAAGNNDTDLVQHLLSLGADARDSGALLAAVQNGNSALVRALITAYSHAGVNAREEDVGRALQRAISDNNSEIVGLLLEGGINVNKIVRIWIDRWGKTTALGNAVIQEQTKTGDFPMARMLLDAGADPNDVVTHKLGYVKSILVAAVERDSGSVPLVRLLVKAGANVNASPHGRFGHTPLQAAAEVRNSDLVQILLDAGADVNAQPSRLHGATALQFAATGGYLGIACVLLNAGADVNAAPADEAGRTALEGAAEHGRIDMLQLLLNAGAQLHGHGQEQYNEAVRLARRNGHRAAARLLESHYNDQPVSPASSFNIEDWIRFSPCET